LVSRATELGASDDVATQTIVRQVRATVLAQRGELAEAERLAREAVDLMNTTDMLFARGEAYEDLGFVLYAAGKTTEGEHAIEQALDLYEAKGAIARADRARRQLAKLQASTS
jgi:Flp pilus assembly protein TadD